MLIRNEWRSYSNCGQIRPPSDLPRRAHGVEHAGNHLRGTGAAGVVGRVHLEHFRMREDDPELIVQLMKQLPQLVHAWRPLALISLARPGRTGSRHSESAKMRIDPPAVRTYSTFPAEIQL